MVHYKVTYFPLRGAAEVIRQILVIAKQDFEDVRIPREEWPQHKGNAPFGQVPVFEEDGKQLAQSHAIARYLARKYDLAGQNPWEQAQVDALADLWKDLQKELHPFFAVLVGQTEGDKEKLKNEVFTPGINKYLPFYINALKKSGSGYFIGSSLSWVDLLVAEQVSFLATTFPDDFENFPELKAHIEKVRSNPELKKWIETRPVTPF